MPKTRKPTTTRKPPEPSTSHDEVEEWTGSVMPALQPIVRSLDELIRERERVRQAAGVPGWT